MSKHENPYLWDRSGEGDPEIERLERLLAPLGHRGAPPVWPQRRTPARRGLRVIRRMLAAAAVLVLAAAGWFTWGAARGGWTVESLAGQPRLDGASLVDAGLLKRGGQLVTDSQSRARIDVGRIGLVEVEPDSRVALVTAGTREHRLSLERGTIHARIWAPPRFFFVNTPSAEAIDLGCAFTLQVGPDGAGLLHVTHGWVQFAYGGREAYIPQGAVGATRPGVGPGTPRYTDAPAGFAEALETLDFGPADDRRRASALDHILGAARPRDELTLWHLLSRGSAGERSRVFTTLAALSPLPRDVTREAVLAGDRRALEAWWDSFELEGTSWWGRLKSRF